MASLLFVIQAGPKPVQPAPLPELTVKVSATDEAPPVPPKPQTAPKPKKAPKPQVIEVPEDLPPPPPIMLSATVPQVSVTSYSICEYRWWYCDSCF